MDANDNSPVFSQAAYAANVNENSAVGRRILTLTATDLDKVKTSTEPGDKLQMGYKSFI